MIKEIISGGQTGVDQAALEAAINAGIPYSGNCPKGRIAENGIIPIKFKNLKEITGEFKSEKENYDARTKKNIEDSDGTLIFVPKIPLPSKITDGTLLTINEVKEQKKPFLLIDLSKNQDINIAQIIDWIDHNQISKLNIAGPRESSSPGINRLAFDFITKTLLHLKNRLSIRPRL